MSESRLSDLTRLLRAASPKRPRGRHGAKSDGLDAVRAGREALARDHLISPRQRGHREALRVLHTTRAAIVAAGADAKQLETELRQLIVAVAPALRTQPGIGPITAAQLLISWSHPGRFRSEAAFAMLAGAAPVPASSGQVVRHRLNRGGDRS